MNESVGEEQPFDPTRPIIDPHFHLWEILPVQGAPQPQRFLMPEALEVIHHSGHNITHTVFVECQAMYRQDGPIEFKPVGETEFANGISAMSASGGYGRCSIAHRIVGNADLLRGADVAPVLDAHMAAAGNRFRGIRCSTAFSEVGLFGAAIYDSCLRELMMDSRFREGARLVARRGLSLDIWCLHTQLDEVISLADAIPDLLIVLDHIGTPECQGRYEGRETEAYTEWAAKIFALAQRPNVLIKLGGLGMDISQPAGKSIGTASSISLAEKWHLYIETCIEAFTPSRCMFESNFPVDWMTASYGATWNAFKIITKNFSEPEKDQLFRRTAAAAYRIELE